MSRIAETFAGLRRDGRTGLVTYTTAGDPGLARSAEILQALDRAGADVLEVGVPFSDPLADGPVIQRATERALAAGTTLRGVLDVVKAVRKDVKAPIVIFSYANPLLRMGLTAFADRASEAGVDGVLALDLPIEEADEFRRVLGLLGERGMLVIGARQRKRPRFADEAHIGERLLDDDACLVALDDEDQVEIAVADFLDGPAPRLATQEFLDGRDVSQDLRQAAVIQGTIGRRHGSSRCG